METLSALERGNFSLNFNYPISSHLIYCCWHLHGYIIWYANLTPLWVIQYFFLVVSSEIVIVWKWLDNKSNSTLTVSQWLEVTSTLQQLRSPFSGVQNSWENRTASHGVPGWGEEVLSRPWGILTSDPSSTFPSTIHISALEPRNTVVIIGWELWAFPRLAQTGDPALPWVQTYGGRGMWTYAPQWFVRQMVSTKS